MLRAEAPEAIGLYSSSGHTGSMARVIKLPEDAVGKRYRANVIVQAGVSPTNVFPILVMVSGSSDGAAWTLRDTSTIRRNIETGPDSQIIFASSFDWEGVPRFARVVVSSDDSTIAVAVALERL